MPHDRAECRDCRQMVPCDAATHHEVERVSHDEGRCDIDYTVLTGQCDDCLSANGPDEFCDVFEAQDETYARAEAEYRTWDRGEL